MHPCAVSASFSRNRCAPTRCALAINISRTRQKPLTRQHLYSPPQSRGRVTTAAYVHERAPPPPSPPPETNNLILQKKTYKERASPTAPSRHCRDTRVYTISWSCSYDYTAAHETSTPDPCPSPTPVSLRAVTPHVRKPISKFVSAAAEESVKSTC